MSREDDSLLSRWSRRKLASATPDAPEPEPSADVSEPNPDDDLPEAELLQKLGLPDPDTLKSGDDFKAFMAKNVPEYLRQRALRRLWPSNPVLANVDGLVDYGGDFTDAAMVPEVLKTAYQVGRGFLRDVVEPDANETDKEDAAPDDQTPQPVLTSEVDPDPESDEPMPEKVWADLPVDDAQPPRPRRMAFRSDP